MRQCIWMCCVLATLAAALRGQEAGASAGAGLGEPPSPDQAMAAYRAVDGWVRAWRVGKVEVFREEEVNVPACVGVSVTLRLSGEVIGRGVEVAANDAARRSIVADATRAALADAQPRLGVPRDAMYDATVKDLAKRVTVSLQLAGELVPISPKDAGEAMAMVAPGVEGVAVRLGDRLGANFPERMLTSGTEPGPALGTLAGQLAGEPSLAVEPLSKLAKDRGAVFYRFRVAHLAQARTGKPPVFLTRCGRVVRRQELDEVGLREWADALAGFLIPPPTPPNQSGCEVAGLLNPISGARNPPVADLRSSAIVAGALFGYSNAPGVAPERARRAFETGQRMMASLCRYYESGLPDVEPVAAGLTQWAFSNYHAWRGGGFDASSMMDRVEEGSVEELWGQWTLKKSGEETVLDKFVPIRWPDDTWKSSGAGAIALGMVLSFDEAKQYQIEGGKETARQAVSKTLLGSGPAELVSHMPWLGYAQVNLVPQGEIGAAVAIREMRAQLWEHQLQLDALTADQQDLGGGIVFSAKQPMPTWQMARPLAFVATMLGDPRLTEEEEVPEELSRLLLSLRFLRQLTAGDAAGFMYKNPERAMGGVRASLWDQRMPPEATAMTLITVCETLRSLEEIEKRRREGK